MAKESETRFIVELPFRFHVLVDAFDQEDAEAKAQEKLAEMCAKNGFTFTAANPIGLPF